MEEIQKIEKDNKEITTLPEEKNESKEIIWYSDSLDEFKDLAESNKHRNISLVGNYGVGKSRFIQNSLKNSKLKIKYIEADNIINESKVIQQLITSSLGYTGFADEKIKPNINTMWFLWWFNLSKRITSIFTPIMLSILGIFIPIALDQDFSLNDSMWIMVIALPYLLWLPTTLLAFCNGLFTCSKNKLLIIDNMDRISFAEFEKIIEITSNLNIKNIVIFDIQNIRVRYKERFSFESQDLIGEIEKYAHFTYNLESRITNEYFLLFQEQEIPEDYGIVDIVNYLYKINFTNLRVIKKVIEDTLPYVALLSMLKIRYKDVFFIKLLYHIDYVGFQQLSEDNEWSIKEYDVLFNGQEDKIYELSEEKYQPRFAYIANEYTRLAQHEIIPNEVTGVTKELLFNSQNLSKLQKFTDSIINGTAEDIMKKYVKGNNIERMLCSHILKEKGMFNFQLLGWHRTFDMTRELYQSDIIIEDAGIESLSVIKRLSVFHNILHEMNGKYRFLNDYTIGWKFDIDKISDSSMEDKWMPWLIKEIKSLQEEINKINSNDDFYDQILNDVDSKYSFLVHELINTFATNNRALYSRIHNYQFDEKFMFAKGSTSTREKTTNYYNLNALGIDYFSKAFNISRSHIYNHPKLKGVDINWSYGENKLSKQEKEEFLNGTKNFVQ